MNELTRKIHGIFRPKAALIAYECGEGYSRDCYLELRPINENGRMGAAVPVSYKTAGWARRCRCRMTS